MDLVKKDRRALSLEVTRLESIIGAYDVRAPPSLPEILHQEGKLQSAELKCTTLTERASAVAKDDAEFLTEAADILVLTEKVSKSSIKLAVLKATYPPASGSGGTPSAGADIKLPKLEIPPFKGETQNWLSFQDLFTSSIHNNSKLSDSQKFQYLKGLLHGEPATLIKDIPVTDVNYTTAWDILKTRYEIKRDIIKTHFEKLNSIQNLQQANPTLLRRIGDAANECERALDVLKLTDKQKWDSLIIYLLTKKLDSDSRIRWEEKLTGDEIPNMQKFTEFILAQARATAAGDIKAKAQNTPKNSTATTERKQAYHSTSEKSNLCVMCNEKHPLHRCSTFRKATIDDRWSVVWKERLCHMCFHNDHYTKDCPTSFTCHKQCEKQHNSMLCRKSAGQKPPRSNPEKKTEAPSESTSEPVKELTTAFSQTGSTSQVLLSTAIILVKDSKNTYQKCRALLDDGSQGSFITTKCATRLGLKRKAKTMNIYGVGGVEVGKTTQCVDLKITSCHNQRKIYDVETHIKKDITGDLPTYPVDSSICSNFKNMTLADPQFYQPGKIDILLGRDICDELVLMKQKRGPLGTPTARHTVFGWIIGGPVKSKSANLSLNNYHMSCTLESTLQKFWELEEVPTVRELTKEEKECEQHFHDTHERDSEGRFWVNLPFKENSKPLGESRNQAVRRLKQGERQRSNHPGRQEEYNQVLEEYLSLGHMEEIEASCENPERTYYIPHHAVYKPTSTTTKVRVVYDASAKTTNGVSLNENMLTGPKLQSDLIVLLIRFRTHIIAFVADVVKMYRQIKIKLEDRDFHRIVWRRSSNLPITDYRLTTVTFGTTAAPYLAVKCLQQLAFPDSQSEENQITPTFTSTNQINSASAAILHDFYVDDLMSGAKNEKEAIKLKTEITNLLAKGKMQLRKWSSNSNKFLETIPPEDRETKFPLQIDEDDTTKTLGLTWNPATDVFSISVVPPPAREEMTKRTLLSDLAKTFDPLGFLSPATIKAKLIFQSLWQLKLDWDDPLPIDHQQEWLKYLKEFPTFKNIKIERCIVQADSEYDLHGFCDASQDAYAACVYLRSTNQKNKSKVNLVAAKTKVAPLKEISLARKELCGASLLSKLMEVVKTSLNLPIRRIYYWSDSTIVLAWIGSPSHRWKVFVANRVERIRETSTPDQWSHVRGIENPADCASRGISPAALENHPLWWTGPDWLLPYGTPNEFSTNEPNQNEHLSISEEERTIARTHHSTTREDLLGSCSTLLKLQRVTARVLRFCFIIRHKTSGLGATLTVPELNTALNYWIKVIQAETYPEIIKSLKLKQNLPKNEKHIQSLCPFLDNDEILRVGGRLQNSNLTYGRKHPILLPKKNQLTTLILEYYHRILLHGGAQVMLSQLQNKFWIVGARQAIQKIIRNCTTCFKIKAETALQMMGNLPAPRVTQTRPFQIIGVDFAGPFNLCLKKGRGQKQFKYYVAVFICFVVRAIHLELVSDLTTDAFIAAFRRFTSRRGLCTDVYSDCGTNFVGACNELKTYMKKIQSSEYGNHLKEELAKDGITWHFNPPSAPHFGGLWEAGVKSFKYHLKRIMGIHTLSTEEMQTVLAEIEACLNSRPLTALSSDPNDYEALTPGHFLIGSALKAIPEPDVTHLKPNRMDRWETTKQQSQLFWHRWSAEYLSRLQQRPKWWLKKENLKIGDLVLIKDERLPPLKWKMGRILEIFPGTDDMVRAVTVKAADGTYQRPIVKLCPLPLDQD